MAQNIYDDPAFFAAYATLRRSQEGLDGAPEWPVLRAMLPPMAGLRVLDLGCGFGWFARWARGAGAASVAGIDLSANMLARAEAATDDGAISYRRADLETIDLPDADFDLAWSALALHYIVDLARLLASVHRALRPGGRFVLSMEHPILTAPSEPAWREGRDGRCVWPLDRYAMEGERATNWLADCVRKQHRTMATILNECLGAGFTIEQIEEFAPSDAQIAKMPALAIERHRPMFLLLALGR